MNRSFLWECREAARLCPDILLRKLLHDATDDLGQALLALTSSPTQEKMQRANAMWARAFKAKEKALPVPDPIPPRSSAGELEQMAA